ncbi:MAG: 30S ribosomal protein S12 methylthiotransferase RimO [Armatimonadetes bacterium]|nr:30S ribosomal protein S12 methylthiotransferase RimO [Armatimonadota bacterium]
MGEGARVAIVNLGCPKNQVDAEVMLGLLQREGLAISGDPAAADVIIVNTCGFIADAKEESVNALLEAVRLKREGKAAKVIAAGCLAQRYATELHAEIPELDGIVGIGQQERIAEAVRAVLAGEAIHAVGAPRAVLPEELPRVLSTPPWTAYLKIADGCDRPCAFCAIPAIRGKMISRPLEAIVAEARDLAARGVRELNLVAQETSRYGLDRYGHSRLVDLLRALSAIDGIEWIRPLYYFPTSVSEELIALIASEPKLCKYIDIPLQHVSRSVLRRMRRPGDGERYLELIARIRAACPEVALRTAFIVGYPGETEADFAQLLDFVKEARLDRVGAFIFSPEENTPAASLPNRVPARTARARYARLMATQQRISLQRNREFVGKPMRVLVEQVAESGERVGRSYRDAPEIDGSVRVTGSEARPGEFVDVMITAAQPYDLMGEAQPSR